MVVLLFAFGFGCVVCDCVCGVFTRAIAFVTVCYLMSVCLQVCDCLVAWSCVFVVLFVMCVCGLCLCA